MKYRSYEKKNTNEQLPVLLFDLSIPDPLTIDLTLLLEADDVTVADGVLDVDVGGFKTMYFDLIVSWTELL